MIIDATDLILGRMATKVAKLALEGEPVTIVNCSGAVVSGNKRQILNRFKQKLDMGAPLKGPYFPKYPERIVRRVVRGMLPYKQEKGEKAFKRVMCYRDIPDKLKNEKIETIENAKYTKLPNLKFVRVMEISKFLGAKL